MSATLLRSASGLPEAGAPSWTIRLVRWLLPLSGLLALAGYFGPWLPHRAAGLVITGLDLGEVVKFLPPVQSGQIPLWREGFYLPLVAVSLAFGLHAWRGELGYPWPVRVALLGVAAVAGLNLLPPAWTPQRLLTPEFRLQTGALIACLALAGVSPLLALLPRWLSALATLAVILPALGIPLQGFLRVLPVLSQLYNRPLAPGWGLWVTELGLLGLAVSAGLLAWPQGSPDRGPERNLERTAESEREHA